MPAVVAIHVASRETGVHLTWILSADPVTRRIPETPLQRPESALGAVAGPDQVLVLALRPASLAPSY